MQLEFDTWHSPFLSHQATSLSSLRFLTLPQWVERWHVRSVLMCEDGVVRLNELAFYGARTTWTRWWCMNNGFAGASLVVVSRNWICVLECCAHSSSSVKALWVLRAGARFTVSHALVLAFCSGPLQVRWWQRQRWCCHCKCTLLLRCAGSRFLQGLVVLEGLRRCNGGSGSFSLLVVETKLQIQWLRCAARWCEDGGPMTWLTAWRWGLGFGR